VKTDVEGEEEQVFEVDTYSLPYMGPYPSDVLRVNTVRYTPTQGTLLSITSTNRQLRQSIREVDLV